MRSSLNILGSLLNFSLLLRAVLFVPIQHSFVKKNPSYLFGIKQWLFVNQKRRKGRPSLLFLQTKHETYKPATEETFPEGVFLMYFQVEFFLSISQVLYLHFLYKLKDLRFLRTLLNFPAYLLSS